MTQFGVKIGRAGAATGRFALRPLHAVAYAGRDALTDEAQRVTDGVMAGPLPEVVGRSLVRHHVLERLAAGALAENADVRVEELLRRTIQSRVTSELVDEIVQSAAFKSALKSALASAEVREAMEGASRKLRSDVLNARAGARNGGRFRGVEGTPAAGSATATPKTATRVSERAGRRSSLTRLS